MSGTFLPVIPEFRKNLNVLPNANPASDGSCDGCTECCTWLAIREGIPLMELNKSIPVPSPKVGRPKPMGTPCWWLGQDQLGYDKGCGIHDNPLYPKTCRDYKCWAQILLTDAGRPDLYKSITARLVAEGKRTVTNKP